MRGIWQRYGPLTALGQFMRSVDNPSPTPGPPNVTVAIGLAHDELLGRRIPLADVADAAWDLHRHCRDGSSHDLALVTALFFLMQDEAHVSTVQPVRMEARLRAQQWSREGHASLGVVSRFEEALFQRFR